MENGVEPANPGAGGAVDGCCSRVPPSMLMIVACALPIVAFAFHVGLGAVSASSRRSSPVATIG